MAEDNLTIKINLVASKDIETKIDGITASLQKMNNQANNKNFADFAKGVSNLGQAASSLKDMTKSADWAKNFGAALQQIAEFGQPAAKALDGVSKAALKLEDSGLGKFATIIKQISNFLPNLNDDSAKGFKDFAQSTLDGLRILGRFNNEKYTKGITDSVRKLQQIGKGLSAFREGGLGMREVAGNIAQLPEALRQFTKYDPKFYKLVAQNVRAIAPAVQELGKNGSQINEAAKGVERFPKALGQFAHPDMLFGGIEGLKTVLGKMSDAFTAFDKDNFKGFSGVVKALGVLPQALDLFDTDYASSTGNINSILSNLSANLQDFEGPSSKLRTSINALFNLHKAIEMFSNLPEGSEIAFKNIAIALSMLNDAMKNIEAGPATNLKKVATGLRYLERIGGDSSLWERISAGGERMKDFIRNVTDLPDNVVQKFNAIGQALEGIAQGYGKINQAQKALENSKAGQKEQGIARTIVDTSVKMAKDFPKTLKGVTTNFGKFLSLPFKPTVSHIQNLAKTFESLHSRIVRVALNRAIRQGLQLLMNAVKEGVKNLYQWSLLAGDSFANTMNSLSTGFLYLKNSIGAAVSPLLDQLAPALNTVINLVVSLLNAFNQLFAILGGALTWRRAVRQQKEFAQAVGSSAGGAGDLADELERTVLAFDELNKLNDANDKSGGGGGGGNKDNLDYGGLFETVPIDEELANILNSDNWFPLGEKISDWIADGLEKIDWESIKDKAERVAGQLATMLNGIFANDRMWTDIGITIGESINTATTFITKFVTETDWAKLGDDLATVLKTTVQTINWQDVGASLVSGFRIAMQVLHGFVDGMTWEDWHFIGTSIADGINGAIDSIAWENVIPDLVDLAAGILHSINTAFANIDWKQAFSELWKGIREADWGWLWEEVTTAIKNAMPLITIALTITFVKGAFTLGASIAQRAVADWIALELAKNGGLNIPLTMNFGNSGKGTVVTGGGTGGGLSFGSILGLLGGGLLTYSGLSSNYDWRNGDNRTNYAADYLKLLSGGTMIGGSVGGPMGAIAGLVASAIGGVFVETYKGVENAIDWTNNNSDSISAYNEIMRELTSKYADSHWRFGDDLSNVGANYVPLDDWARMLNSPDTYQEARVQIEAFAREVGINVDEILAKYGILSEATKETFTNSVSTTIEKGMDIVKKALNIGDEAYEFGENTGNSYADGLNSTNPIVGYNVDKVGNIVESGLNNGTEAYEFGENTGNSYASGIESTKPTVGYKVDKVGNIVESGLNKSSNALNWGALISSGLSTGLDSKKTAVSTSAGVLKGYLNGIDLSGKSWKWGSDLTTNLANGITFGIQKVADAAALVAQNIANNLEHTVPKEGPLANELEWMPHMMQNLANGIRNNAWRVENEMYDVASSMVLPSSSFSLSGDAEYSLSNALSGLAIDTSNETPIVIYIGEDKLDSVIAKSQGRMNVRSGGR